MFLPPSLVVALNRQDGIDKSKLPHYMRGRHGGGGKSEIRSSLIKKAKRRAKSGKHKSAAKVIRYLERIGTENRCGRW